MESEHLGSNVQCYDQNENVDDAIIESIKDIHNSDEDTDEEPDLPIWLRVAKRHLWKTLGIFIFQQGEGSPISVFDTCSDYISQQSTINNK